jgi:hypothetical protein
MLNDFLIFLFGALRATVFTVFRSAARPTATRHVRFWRHAVICADSAIKNASVAR